MSTVAFVRPLRSGHFHRDRLAAYKTILRNMTKSAAATPVKDCQLFLAHAELIAELQKRIAYFTAMMENLQ